MSDPVAEIPLLAAEWRALLKSAYQEGGRSYPRRIDFLGVFSDGTRYAVENGVRQVSFYVVTDLTSPQRIVGSVSVTILASAVEGHVNVTIALTDPVTSYKLFTTVNDAVYQAGWGSSGRLVSKTLLQVSVKRALTTASSNPTGVSVAGADLSDVDVTLANPHGSDAGLGPHDHTFAGKHPVTDPGHTHSLANTGGQISVNVDWLIWHV